MNHYKITLKHDGGRVVIGVFASSWRAAVAMVMAAERCPRGAIVDTIEEGRP